MPLYAAGFNAWNQLYIRQPSNSEDHQPDDLYALTRVAAHDDIQVVEPHLSYTYVDIGGKVEISGLVPDSHAALREKYGRFSMAANSSVIVSSEAQTVKEYAASYSALMAESPDKTHAFPDEIVQHVAYDVGFAVLTTAGQVWTWGDPRYPGCLGRDVSTSSPASHPGRITDLEALPTGKIIKIAAGGYTLAAITSGHDLYCWGGHPGRRAIVNGVSPSSGPTPVVIEEADVVDVAIGDSHVVALTNHGDVFVIGDNSNGQLGLGGPQRLTLTESWIKVDGLCPAQVVTGVAAGPRATLIKTRTK